MLEDQNELQRIFSTVTKLFKEQGDYEVTKVLNAANISSEMVHYDNWNGGTSYYSINIEIDASMFAYYESKIKSIEEKIQGRLEIFLRGVEGEELGEVIVKPTVKQYIDWSSVSDKTTKEDLLNQLNRIKSIMVSVATGELRIQAVETEYKSIPVRRILGYLNKKSPLGMMRGVKSHRIDP